ncbi:MAG TPA: twin-arginine translocation signal domain-containing protein [Tepidisphaeraceae bacterium]|nr:twin-arginine translocation signal domain-containing protein [Tepidisphaeraceae bacterium]
MSNPSRRHFLKQTTLAAAAGVVVAQLAQSDELTALAADAPNSAAGGSRAGVEPAAGGVELRWLEGAPHALTGASWGVPWPKGKHPKDQAFALTDGDGKPVAVQSWALATWPDGSLKWSGHALGGDGAGKEKLTLAPAQPAAPPRAVTVKEAGDAVTVDLGGTVWTINKAGPSIVESVAREGQPSLGRARLVAIREDQSQRSAGVTRRESFVGQVEKVTVEQAGPIRAVVKLEGKHRLEGAPVAGGAGNAGDRQQPGGRGRNGWLPFTVRLYFYASSDAVRIVHTFVFDGDAEKDFIAGLGVRFDVPMRSAQPHDRHVRFVGEGNGLWAEAVRGLTGLRRDPGREVTGAQANGKATPPARSFPGNVRDRLQYIPAWNDYTLFQSSADGFEIRKRTRGENVAWVKSANGRRSQGTGYVGSPAGGVAFGLRDFWQRHPTALDIRNAATDAAEVTMWLWSPDAPAMDLRFYHDGMGMDTHPKQIEGLEITYEDYEPGFGTATGIARTSEMLVQVLPATPERQHLVDLAKIIQAPPQLAASPQHMHATQVLGVPMWGLPDRSSPASKRIEDVIDWNFAFYKKEVEQRHWYGFWDFGDVMHTYDRDRHEWRYDVGGFAWANSELSPDLWLWHAFLRSGRADIFRFAEAMTRHTGEVDCYHLGRFAGLGTRHGVKHWGDSAKQLRISTAAYRRHFYYLTGGDGRVGDQLTALVDADKQFANLDPIRKVRREKFVPQPRALGVGFGTDWGSLAAAWLAEFERTGNARVRDKLVSGMKSIGAMPKGFFTSGATYDPETGAFTAHGDNVDVSHLSAVFGLPEVCAELIQNFGAEAPEFEKAWLQYCVLYNAPPEEQEKALGRRLGGLNLVSAHSRLTAYAAWKTKDPALARRAWQEFSADDRRWAPQRYAMKTTRVEGPAVLNDVDEAPWISTNDASQWSLSAIANLSMIPDALPDAPAGG